ncbi:dolichol-phosphate mannosyltransferase subunit 1-like [Carica papaya]|uniref:dolichol-phosphate mannosyltransferase subunit 1-like n=1 Tax=Carica papaya TaxID=3649 RepID=UPI000B8D0D04|nr:dolichol-phosphate mannosyltransferase subunit 1-like [Carica papaya]
MEEEKQGKEINKYSIIVPTYNERLNIALIIYLLFKHLKDVDFEIIVVDDGSPDGTQEIVKQLQQVYSEDRIVSGYCLTFIDYWFCDCHIQVPITFVDRVFGSSKLGGSEIVEYLKGVAYLLVAT